ncbi:TPA: threonine/serine transporter [Escherichia coli]|nr:threonine/serine transporter [Escherichia coli]
MKINSIQWPATFFATSFGAGIFFLPQTVGPKVIGTHGTITILIVSSLVSLLGQFTFYKFILITDKKEYVSSAILFIGNKAANAISIAFILSMLLIAIINITTMINIICFNLNGSARIVVSLIISTILGSSFIFFNSKIEHLASGIAFPTLLIVLFLSIYFYSHPAHPHATEIQSISTGNLLILFPVVLFSFNFSPCIQRFAQNKKDTDGDLRFFLFGILLILIFISFIVFSLSNIFSPSDIKDMREINSDALSYSANVTKNSLIAYISILTMILITSGAYTGTLTGIVDTIVSLGFKNKTLIASVVSVITFIAGEANFEIIKVIAALSTPIIAITVFIIPSAFFLKTNCNSIFRKIMMTLNLLIGIGICFLAIIL